MIKKIFYSYSHQDEKYLSELQKYLKPAIEDYQIEVFIDKDNIRCGEPLNEKIMQNLSNSDLIISLISANYLASEYCLKEMSMALDNNKSFPVILSHCDWKNNELLKSIKVLPKDGKPIIDYTNSSEAYQFIASEFRQKIQKDSNIIALKEDFKSKLEKINFLHPNKSKISLSDTFVAPNIKNSSDEKNKENIFKIEEILKNENYKEVLFFSPFYSGKTSLLKYVYLLLLQQDIYPLYIQGKNIVKTKYFENDIKKCFDEQYNGNYDIWKKVNQIYFLIDDYNHSINNGFIVHLRENFDNARIIITIEQEEYFSFFKDFPHFTTFKSFELKPFNRQQQEEIIKKWLILKDENIPSNFYNEVDIVEDKINNIVSSQIILPRYPTNILLILQTIDNKTNDMKITSYGHCYYALILNYLVKNGITENDSIDTSLNFLSELSYSIYSAKESYTKQHYNNFKKKYKDEFIIQDSILKRLENGDYPILYIKDNEIIRFEQDFIYYYFLGKILAEKISTTEIESLCENIHQKINMYIIVFIIHHSKNMELIDEIILRCMLVLDKTKEASYLNEETPNFIQELDIPKLIMNATSIEENRTIDRKIQDENEIDYNKLEEEEDENEIYKGIKLSEALSQILKNRSGSFAKNKVKEIVDALIGLQLRVNKMIFEVCEDKDFEKFIIQSLKEYFKKSDKKVSDDEAQKFVKHLVASLSVGGSLGVVNGTSFLVYTDNIIDDLENLIETNKQPSREIILFLTSIKKGITSKHLKHLENMIRQHKNKNFFAFKILSLSIQYYLNTHSIDKTTEFKICKMLSLPEMNRAADKLLDKIHSN